MMERYDSNAHASMVVMDDGDYVKYECRLKEIEMLKAENKAQLAQLFLAYELPHELEREIERLKSLLGRYAQHVVYNEGVTFIDDYYDGHYLNAKEMKEIASYCDECEK